MKIELREPRIADAKRYLEILSHPDFTYFPAKPATLKEEQDFLRMIQSLRRQGRQYDFAVLADGQHVGGAGVRIKERFTHIGVIGYFIDRDYWNKGIATTVVELLEGFIATRLNLTRLEIDAATKNIPSCKVAVKCGYRKEGVMRKYLKVGSVYHDCCLYAKLLK